MLGWGLAFLVIAILAAALGFGGVLVGTALFAAKVIFVVALVIWIISLFAGRTPRSPL